MPEGEQPQDGLQLIGEEAAVVVVEPAKGRDVLIKRPSEFAVLGMLQDRSHGGVAAGHRFEFGAVRLAGVIGGGAEGGAGVIVAAVGQMMRAENPMGVAEREMVPLQFNGETEIEARGIQTD